VLFPSELTFRLGQGQQPQRSPLKRDTEAILHRLDDFER